MSTNDKFKQTLTLIYTSMHTERLRTIEMCDLTTLKSRITKICLHSVSREIFNKES